MRVLLALLLVACQGSEPAKKPPVVTTTTNLDAWFDRSDREECAEADEAHVH